MKNEPLLELLNICLRNALRITWIIRGLLTDLFAQSSKVYRNLSYHDSDPSELSRYKGSTFPLTGILTGKAARGGGIDAEAFDPTKVPE